MEEQELERMIAEEDYSNLWRVPMSLGEPRKEKDKSGGECWAAEVAINTNWFEQMTASQVHLSVTILYLGLCFHLICAGFSWVCHHRCNGGARGQIW